MVTTNLSIQQPANGADVGTWDSVVNATSQTIDTAFGTVAMINATGLSGVQTLTLAQYGCASLVVTGSPTASITFQLPAGVARFLFVWNLTSDNSIWFASANGGTTIEVQSGVAATVVIDPINGARFGDTANTGAGGSANQVQVNAGGALAGATGLVYAPSTSGLSISGPLTVGGNVGLGTVTEPLDVQASAATLTQALAFQTAAMPIDCSKSNVFRVTLTTNMSSPPVFSNMVDGQTVNIQMQQDSTGNRTALWPSSFRWVNGTPGVLSTAPGAIDMLVATFINGVWLAALLTGFA